jgi:CheY-like chemotaxis protein
MRLGAAVAKLHRMTISCLIVDDNRPFLEAARTLLEREGLTVAGVATTSIEALRQAETLRPDIVLVDIALGEENGFDLARQLVQDGVGAESTVVLISTRAEEDVADQLTESPAAGFLSKTALSAAAILQIVDGGASARRGK